jgi:hypothetical protein
MCRGVRLRAQRRRAFAQVFVALLVRGNGCSILTRNAPPGPPVRLRAASLV